MCVLCVYAVGALAEYLFPFNGRFYHSRVRFFTVPCFRCLGRFDTASWVVSVGKILGLLFNESGIFLSNFYQIL